MADNMLVTALNTGLPENNSKTGNLNISNNPITNSTRISFSILKADNISISVYDLSGKLVSTLFEGTVDAGRHQLNWNVAENGPATGEYILKVEGANFRQSIKVAILHP
jgi:flagellar hook assembly protein FlgD